MKETFFFKELSDIDFDFQIYSETGYKKISTKYGDYYLQSFKNDELMKCIVYLKARELTERMKKVNKEL